MADNAGGIEDDRQCVGIWQKAELDQRITGRVIPDLRPVRPFRADAGIHG
jgi:hypothetical protein